MRIANLHGRAHVLVDDGAVDVEELTRSAVGPDPSGAWGHLDEIRHAMDRGWDAHPYDTAALGAPSPSPRQVVAIGLNYRAHAAEMGLVTPAMPAAFTKFPSCLTGPFDDVILWSETVDWEAEIVVVIGRTAHRVHERDAWAHVAGITVGQDLSDRDVQVHTGGQFALAKSFAGYGPTGPWGVTVDELDDPDRLHITCTLNGEVVQDAWSTEQVLSIPALIARLTSVLTLWPGDLIFTGSPSGTGVSHDPPRYLVNGDVLVTSVDGVGTLRNAMIAAHRDLTNPD